MSFSITTLRGFINKINQGGGGFDYTEFCNLYNSSLITGLTVTSSIFGTLPDIGSQYITSSTSDTLTFSLNASLQQYLIDNSHARLRYNYEIRCIDGTSIYYIFNVDITNELTLQLNDSPSCGGIGTDHLISIIFDTDDSSPLYEDVCNGIVTNAPSSITYIHTIGLNQ